MNPEIEKLINIAAKGEKVTDRQREIIREKAISLGEDPDEVEFVLELKIKEYRTEKTKADHLNRNRSFPDTSETSKCDETIDNYPTNKESVARKKVARAKASAGALSITANTLKKKRPVAIFLAISLGGLGVHRFYLGNTFLGIIYLLFCWSFIPWIIGWVDALIMLCEGDDCFYGNLQ